MPKVHLTFIGDNGDRTAAVVAGVNVAAAVMQHGAKVTFVTKGRRLPAKNDMGGGLGIAVPTNVALANFSFEIEEKP